jgi:sulfur-oxidizing protein SoxX
MTKWPGLLLSVGLAVEPAQAAAQGDPAKGRAIVADRQLGLCLLCHSGPFPEVLAQGDLAPDLSGAGQRWTVEQLRQRIADPARFNPATFMPAYGPRSDRWRVAPAWRDKPLLSKAQIDDVAAFLATLKP